MQSQIIDAAAKKIAVTLMKSDDVDAAALFAETLTGMLADPVAGILQSIEETRDVLDEAMQVAASGRDWTAPDELPKPAGMPMLDVSEISKQIVIEKSAVLSLLGKGMLTSHVRRKVEIEYDRALLGFLSLYANRLRRWMEQNINALRNALPHSLTCIARTLTLPRFLVYPTYRPFKMTFGFCANGNPVTRRLNL